MEEEDSQTGSLAPKEWHSFELSDLFFLTHLFHIGSGEASFSIMPGGEHFKSPKKSMLSLAKTLREGLRGKIEMLDVLSISTMRSKEAVASPLTPPSKLGGESGCICKVPQIPVFKR